LKTEHFTRYIARDARLPQVWLPDEKCMFEKHTITDCLAKLSASSCPESTHNSTDGISTTRLAATCLGPAQAKLSQACQWAKRPCTHDTQTLACGHKFVSSSQQHNCFKHHVKNSMSACKRRVACRNARTILSPAAPFSECGNATRHPGSCHTGDTFA
jgi:hypothetical protein